MKKTQLDLALKFKESQSLSLTPLPRENFNFLEKTRAAIPHEKISILTLKTSPPHWENFHFF